MELFKHQREAIDFILARGGSGAIFHEMGLGKTRTALEIFSKLGIDHMLVVAPISLLRAAWMEDAQKFHPEIKINNMSERGIPEKWFHPTGDHPQYIWLINYELLRVREKQVRQFIRSTCSHWLCVLDESSKIKNYKSAITKTLINMSGLFGYRLVMTGTPAPNTELEYWPQMQFAEPDCLGTSMTVFRAHFFHLLNRYTKQVMPAIFTSQRQAAETFRKCDYAITVEKREELMSFIRPIAHMAKKKDCLDLPDQVDEVREVDMAPDQARAYQTMKNALVLEIQNQTIAAPVALTKLIKLRQITSGFVYNANGEAFEVSQSGGNPEQLIECVPATMGEQFTNPKIDELFELIEESGNQQIIIWINFHWEQIKVCHELFKKFGPESVVTLSSLTKDKEESIIAFQSGRARFLVAHPASAAHGLTFVNCSLQVFFSLNYSLEQYEQAKARTHRAGQVNKCTYVHLIAKNTIDRDILDVLREKGDMQKIVYEYMKKNS